MGLKINGSTSGSIEIDVPAVAGTDTSITIPAKNGGTFIVEESTGNIDLGPLDINGSASDDSVNIDASGRLLVGTTSSSANNRAVIQGRSDNASTTGTVYIQRGAANPGSNSGLGQIFFADSAGSQGAYIYTQADGAWSTDNYLTRMVFGTTASGASSPSERVRIRNNGNLRINCNNFGADVSGSNSGVEFTPGSFPVFRISSGDATSNNVAEFYNTNGQVGRIATSGSSTSYNTSSDYRLKENVVDLDGAIDRVKQLAPKRFNFIADADTTVDGFLAHEAQAVVPEAVTGTHDEVDDEGNPVYQGIDQSKLVPLLTAALQEAIGKIETLETANASLEARLTALEGGAS